MLGFEAEVEAEASEEVENVLLIKVEDNCFHELPIEAMDLVAIFRWWLRPLSFLPSGLAISPSMNTLSYVHFTPFVFVGIYILSFLCAFISILVLRF